MNQIYGHWGIPTSIHCGPNKLELLPVLCKNLNLEMPLLVTDKGLATQPITLKALDILQSNHIKTNLFCEIDENITIDNIKQGVCFFKQNQHDSIIAFGGGSAMDAGKAIALMCNQTLPLTHFIDEGERWRDAVTPLPHIIAIPTTAGTGSEVGRCAVVKNKNNQKLIIFHPHLLAKEVILDPELTTSLPPHLTAFTGMDALSHNLEAYCVNSFHPIADAVAKEAICLIKKSLLSAYEYPDDILARTQMMVASTMGATAFQKGLGAMHALSHAIGGLYGCHHGMLNAILMPYVLQFNRVAIEDKIINLAKTLNLAKPSFDGFVNWILDLRTKMAVPNDLSALNIKMNAADVVQYALIDPSAKGNPVPLDLNGLETIFSQATTPQAA